MLLFFFNDTATTEIYTLSLHDALPISAAKVSRNISSKRYSFTIAPISRSSVMTRPSKPNSSRSNCVRSEEHTSELQSQSNLVCRLLLEKKKKTYHICHY